MVPEGNRSRTETWTGQARCGATEADIMGRRLIEQDRNRRAHPGWRIVATAVATVMGLVGALVAPAAAAPLTAVDVQRLEASYQAQRAALAQRQAAELARFDATWVQTLADRQAAAEAEQADLRAQRDAAVAPVEAQRRARLAEVEAERVAHRAATDQRFAAKRVARQQYAAQRQAEIPPGATPLSADSSSVKNAVKALDARLKNDRTAAKSTYDTTLRALADRYALAKTSSKDATKAYQGQLNARIDALEAAYEDNVAEAEAEAEARIAQLEEELERLEATYDSRKAAVEAQMKREVAAAKAAGVPTRPIEDAYKARLAELEALFEIQEDENDANLERTEDALELLLADLETKFTEQYAYQLFVDAAQVSAFDAEGDLGVRDVFRGNVAAMLTYAELSEDLKDTYDLDRAVLLRDAAAAASAAAAFSATIDKQLDRAIKADEDLAKDMRKLVDKWADAQVVVVRAPFERAIQQSIARVANDLVDLTNRRDDARSTLLRRHARETLLAKSDWKILKTKAEKYLKSAHSSLVPLDNFYDPASDHGSLFNVAKSIRVPSNVTGAGVRVALIDTGVAPVPGLTQADVTIGPDFSFEDMDDDTRGLDTNGHGTHLAGIIIGRDDAWVDGDRGRAANRALGIAPDARLTSIKAGAADGSTDVSQVIAAINWVIRFNAENPSDPFRVINLAYGTDSEQDYTVDPLAYAAERAWKAGVVVVVSAGNDGWDTSHLAMPAADPFVLAVGAVQVADDVVETDFSSEGSQDRGVDLVAPGRSIVSLRNPGSFSEQVNGAGRAGDTLVRGSGTSQAAAVVTGAVALLLQQRPNLTPDQVKTLLKATAKATEAGDPRLSGAGLLDIGKALGHETIYDFGQQWAPATGAGSLEASRGNSHVLRDDGTPLIGEQDVFGLDFSGSRWREDAWSGSRWRDAGWEGSRWRDAGWDGSRWRTYDWEGSRWRDGDWSGSRWRDAGWDGSRWRDAGWDGSRWRGSRWRDSSWDGSRWRNEGWDGSRWRDNSWEGSRWRGFGSL